jgi:diguanylate cyclase (GGDEF)-like protein
MQDNDIENNKFKSVETKFKNEIGMLFDGYNKMISKIIKTTKVLRYQSHHDSLTGLYNRYAIEKEIESALQDEKSSSNVLINLDLDQFKAVNDSVGHVAGDELLQMVAHSMKQLLPADVAIARVGGDDFFILLKNTTQQQGIKTAKNLLQQLSDFRFVWQGETLSISASIGLVVFQPFEYTLTNLIKSADIAFYNAKAIGQNKLHVYSKDDKTEKQLVSEIQIAGFIKEALKDGPSRFELYAQDIVPLQRESSKVSYEILIRMFDSQGNFLPPDTFLPVAERYQLMVDIDRHVLTLYLDTIALHPEHLDKLESVHVNLAGGTLNQPDFQNCVKDAIKQYHFPWERLELEITETSSIGNLVHAEEFITFCKQRGIGFALDDFGTGMSSFEYLKNLPFDIVKIDGSFVRDMLTDPVDHAMIRYTHEISKLRDQETVAEYVETKADVDELRKIGITYGQGYYLGKPRPLAEWLNE